MTIRSRPEKLGLQQRSFALRANDAAFRLDAENRTITFPFSSDEPIDMWYGTEVLSHEAASMRIGPRQDTMPLLYNHCRDVLLGKVESIQLDSKGGQGICTVRFGRDTGDYGGEWAMQQVADGILVNVSFMYRVYTMVEDVDAGVLTAIDWEPYEISLVTIPADVSVGVGRSISEEEMSVEIRSATKPAAAEPQETPPMKKHLFQDPEPGAAGGSAGGAAGAMPPAPVDQAALRIAGAEGERARIEEIDQMCRAHNVSAELRDGLIKKGASIEMARGAVLDYLKSRTHDPAVNFGPGYAPDLSNREKGRYSLCRAIRAYIDKNWKEAGLELEISNEIAKRLGRSTAGFFAPTNMSWGQRTQYQVDGTPGGGTTGGTLVATTLLPDAFIDVLRNKCKVMSLGATVLSGLVGNIVIPRQDTAATTYWVGETGAITESEGTFDSISLSYKTVGCLSTVTREMLMQATPAIEQLIRQDLTLQMALAIDLAALSGSGSGGVPLGIANTSGIGSVVGGTNGAEVNIDNVIELETALTAANVDEEKLAYLMNAVTVGYLKRAKSSTGQYLWTTAPYGQRSASPGEINGYPVARSNQARSNLTKGTSTGVCSELFFGNWGELIVGEWGVLEIVPNIFDSTLYPQGGVKLRAMQSCDIAVRHPVSFATMSDALTV